MDELEPLSKYLSYLLRHGAEKANLTMDSKGFVALEELERRVQERFEGNFGRSAIERVIEGKPGSKKRLGWNKNRTHVRALYGHSRTPKMNYEPVTPPPILYHGTTPHALPSIQKQGLLPMQRQYVHLSTTQEQAILVAQRRTSTPILLQIDAWSAHLQNVVFFQPEADLLLTSKLPPHFLQILPF